MLIACLLNRIYPAEVECGSGDTPTVDRRGTQLFFRRRLHCRLSHQEEEPVFAKSPLLFSDCLSIRISDWVSHQFQFRGRSADIRTLTLSRTPRRKQLRMARATKSPRGNRAVPQRVR